MGKFRDFVLKHLGKSEDAKNLYKFLQQNDYNNFENFPVLKREDVPENHKKVLVGKLLILKEFISLDGDYNSSLSFADINKQVAEAQLRRCRISKLDNALDDNDKEFLNLMKKQFAAQLDPYETISESHYSQQDSAEVRNKAIAYYGLQSAKHCQVLGPDQQEHVKIVNAHILPRSATDQLPIFRLEKSDVHNPRNILRLHQCLERDFDKREITFVQGDQTNEFKLKLLNESLRNTELKGTNITFGSVEGSSLQIYQDGRLPYRRLLARQSLLSHRHARAQGWLESTEDLSHAEIQASNMIGHSLDALAQARIKLLMSDN
eukprot:scaffold3189_cov166-Amphora_coffeaeformis.AAC.9